jgi:hypothetical protein
LLTAQPTGQDAKAVEDAPDLFELDVALKQEYKNAFELD